MTFRSLRASRGWWAYTPLAWVIASQCGWFAVVLAAWLLIERPLHVSDIANVKGIDGTMSHVLGKGIIRHPSKFCLRCAMRSGKRACEFRSRSTTCTSSSYPCRRKKKGRSLRPADLLRALARQCFDPAALCQCTL